MNRFPTWKYALIALVIAAAFLYTLPNFFGEAPAVQVSSARSTVKLDTSLLGKIEQALKAANVAYGGAIEAGTLAATAARLLAERKRYNSALSPEDSAQ